MQGKGHLEFGKTETPKKDCASLFDEPEDFRPGKPIGKQESFTRLDGSVIDVKLVGEHSLWAHYIWNSGKWLANLIDSNPSMVQGKNVLELGAGAALPSIVSCLNKAKFVCCTDYPDQDILKALYSNFESNVSSKSLSNFSVLGFVWGSDTVEILQAIQINSNTNYFDVIFLSDVIFNHTEHGKLLRNCRQFLNPIDGTIHCVFSHHRVHLIDADLSFFEKAKSEFGFDVSYVASEKLRPMFENDPGDETIRATVHYYILKNKMD